MKKEKVNAEDLYIELHIDKGQTAYLNPDYIMCKTPQHFAVGDGSVMIMFDTARRKKIIQAVLDYYHINYEYDKDFCPELHMRSFTFNPEPLKDACPQFYGNFPELYKQN